MTKATAQYDLIVVGLGAMGAAVTYHATKLGLRVLGIDRHSPPHDQGSTSAESRITRLAVGEGMQYLPFVARSHELWRILEHESGQDLLHQSGGYIVTSPGADQDDRWGDFVTATDNVARQADLRFDLIDPAIVRLAHPQIHVSDAERIGFEPTAGIVMAERAVEVQLALASAGGAEIRLDEPVTAIEPDAIGVDVTTANGAYRAGHVVNATGPWMADFADPADAAVVEVTRQIVLWFEADDLDAFRINRMPFFMWIAKNIEEYVAIFPTPPDGTQGVKVLCEQFSAATSPDAVERSVSHTEIDDFYDRLLAPRVAGITRNCLRSQVCLYTNTPDDHFLIDDDPRSDRITIMSPCSGHGFKHSTALGEAVAQRMATGASQLDLTAFGRARFDITA